MSKADLLTELNNAKSQLRSYRTKLSTLKDKLSTIDTFSKECTSRIQSFEGSMSRRRKRLLSFDSLISSVKAAAKYKEKMSTMLTGTEFTNTTNSIDQLQSSISTERRKIIGDIQYVEDQISYWESRVSTLQYEYNNYPEEVEESGK